MPTTRRAQRPEGMDSYEEWLRSTHEIDAGPRLRAWYETATQQMRVQLESSTFWARFNGGMRSWADEYTVLKGYPLLAEHGTDAPQLLLKSWDSFLLKTYRKNVIDNRDWPEPPPGGWVLPDRCLGQVGDTVRTSVVVKYLDGVRFISQRIANVATDVGWDAAVRMEARQDGYYAAHLAIRAPFEIPGQSWDSLKLQAPFEIQVTTQLQEVIRVLLHRHYEASRVRPDARLDWQWDYLSDEFKANYLGHVLHYLEGMIMGIRDGGES